MMFAVVRKVHATYRRPSAPATADATSLAMTESRERSRLTIIRLRAAINGSRHTRSASSSAFLISLPSETCEYDDGSATCGDDERVRMFRAKRSLLKPTPYRRAKHTTTRNAAFDADSQKPSTELTIEFGSDADCVRSFCVGGPARRNAVDCDAIGISGTLHTRSQISQFAHP